MTFRREVPRKSGWYWVVYVEYPALKPAFVQDGVLWDWGRENRFLSDVRFGDEIVAPDPRDNEVEP